MTKRSHTEYPAKYSPGLIKRIVRHGLAKDYWKAGDTVADPFGGVALGGVVAGYYGLNWIGVELEAQFYRMAEGYECPGVSKIEWVRWYNRFARNEKICPNCRATAQSWYDNARRDFRLGIIPQREPHHFTGTLELCRRQWQTGCYDVTVQLIQGDSRQFAALVGQAQAVVTSPPFVDPNAGKRNNIAEAAAGKIPNIGLKNANDYGQTPGQIGRLRAGQVDAVISSPPYAESIQGKHEETETARESRAARRTEGGSLGQSQRHGGYGVSAGNIGNLKSGRVEAVVSSPPFGEDQPCASQTRAKKDYHAFTRGNGTKYDKQMVSGGNISQLGAGDTYWQAMRDVYEQCRLVLKPGGVMAVVVKDYVKNKQRVPLCDDTLKLLVALGFEPLERIHAMLVKESSHKTLFQGDVTTTKERKSFFRRLAEKNGSPRIDWEEVLFVRAEEG